MVFAKSAAASILAFPTLHAAFCTETKATPSQWKPVSLMRMFIISVEDDNVVLLLLLSMAGEKEEEEILNSSLI